MLDTSSTLHSRCHLKFLSALCPLERQDLERVAGASLRCRGSEQMSLDLGGERVGRKLQDSNPAQDVTM